MEFASRHAEMPNASLRDLRDALKSARQLAEVRDFQGLNALVMLTHRAFALAMAARHLLQQTDELKLCETLVSVVPLVDDLDFDALLSDALMAVTEIFPQEILLGVKGDRAPASQTLAAAKRLSDALLSSRMALSDLRQSLMSVSSFLSVIRDLDKATQQVHQVATGLLEQAFRTNDIVPSQAEP